MNVKFSPRPSVIPPIPPQYRDLTARETEVMEGLADGLPYKEVADKLSISYSAVHKHQQKIYAKLRVMNRTEATVKWRQLTRA